MTTTTTPATAAAFDEADAVFEHTAHSAITAARAISATVAIGYDPHVQAVAELRLADADLDALVRGAR